MKILLSAALTLGLCLSGAALADNTMAGPNTQQNRMTDCNKQATGKTGADRKAFMKACLSGQTTAAAATATSAATTAVDKNGKPLTAQQLKMKNCAAANKGKKGADYKAGMAACLKQS